MFFCETSIDAYYEVSCSYIYQSVCLLSDKCQQKHPISLKCDIYVCEINRIRYFWNNVFHLFTGTAKNIRIFYGVQAITLWCISYWCYTISKHTELIHIVDMYYNMFV